MDEYYVVKTTRAEEMSRVLSAMIELELRIRAQIPRGGEQEHEAKTEQRADGTDH